MYLNTQGCCELVYAGMLDAQRYDILRTYGEAENCPWLGIEVSVHVLLSMTPMRLRGTKHVLDFVHYLIHEN